MIQNQRFWSLYCSIKMLSHDVSRIEFNLCGPNKITGYFNLADTYAPSPILLASRFDIDMTGMLQARTSIKFSVITLGVNLVLLQLTKITALAPASTALSTSISVDSCIIPLPLYITATFPWRRCVRPVLPFCGLEQNWTTWPSNSFLIPYLAHTYLILTTSAGDFKETNFDQVQPIYIKEITTGMTIIDTSQNITTAACFVIKSFLSPHFLTSRLNLVHLIHAREEWSQVFPWPAAIRLMIFVALLCKDLWL